MAPHMEVHHHGHVHHERKWKEYLFQFFMLFLAVFCGFLAEYMLEHKIEKEREKTFVNSFYEDLSNDEAILPELIEEITWQINAAHTLHAILSTANVKVVANSEYMCLRGLIRQVFR
jgi:hypothetical protein